MLRGRVRGDGRGVRGIPVVAVAALGILAACGGEDDRPPEMLERLESRALIEADPSTYEEAVRSLGGKPIVVNFWASWCEPCKDEMPLLVEAAQRYGDRVHFLGVNIEDSEEEARSFISRYGVTYPSLVDRPGDIRRAEQIVGLPTTKFYRGDGELAFVHSGEIDAEELEEKIREVIRVGVPVQSPGP